MPSNHCSTWVLVTDSTTCKLYHYTDTPKQLTLIQEINHPENRLKDIELTSDKPGHYKSGGAGRGAFSQQTDPKEIKIEDFARAIDKILDHGRKINSYEKLIIIAPPHMNGLLIQHINKHVKDLITHNIKKDIMHLSGRELQNFVHEHTQHT